MKNLLVLLFCNYIHPIIVLKGIKKYRNNPVIKVGTQLEQVLIEEENQRASKCENMLGLIIHQ